MNWIHHFLVGVAILQSTSCQSHPRDNRSEFQNELERMFGAYDQDRSGCLSRSEWVAMADEAVERQVTYLGNSAQDAESADSLRGARRAYVASYEHYDRNNNDCITQAEFMDAYDNDLTTHANSMKVN